MCPRCNSADVEIGMPEYYIERDVNYSDCVVPVYCGCGWKGTTEALITGEMALGAAAA